MVQGMVKLCHETRYRQGRAIGCLVSGLHVLADLWLCWSVDVPQTKYLF